MLKRYRAERASHEIHAAFRLTVVTDDANACAKYTTALQDSALAPWSLRGAVYMHSSFGSSVRQFVFEMQAARGHTENATVSDAPTEAIRLALGTPAEAVFTCLGVWLMPSVAP